MLDDIVSAAQKRHNENVEKLEQVHKVLAEFGPLTKEELIEKLERFPWDFEKLWGILTSTNGLNKLSLAVRNAQKYFGLLKNKSLVYMPTQEIELGMRVGYGICSSLTYPHLGANERKRVSSALSGKVSERVLIIVKLHYPGVIDYFIKKNGDIPEKAYRCGNAEQYWEAMRKVKFAGCSEPTDEGKRVIVGAKINLDLGYDAFLNYQRNPPPEDVNWYRWHKQKFEKFLLGHNSSGEKC